jgi:hypothetical protein
MEFLFVLLFALGFGSFVVKEECKIDKNGERLKWCSTFYEKEVVKK